MNYTIRSSQSADAEMASALVQQSFIQLVGPDWEQHAINTFLAETSGNCLRDLISKAAFTAVAEVQGRLVGFILMPSPALIGLLFVKPDFLRNGIANSLWQAARHHIEATCKEVKTVELNSTPYAVAAYRALGFYPISEPFSRGGCLATRMACWLPGDALQARPNQVNEPHC
jgi:ribosomal protein S18 acetylase RimI-like enzyme